MGTIVVTYRQVKGTETKHKEDSEMTEILFGGLEEYGIEVGINEDGRLYEADANDVYYTDDTPENRAGFIEDAERTIAEWDR